MSTTRHPKTHSLKYWLLLSLLLFAGPMTPGCSDDEPADPADTGTSDVSQEDTGSTDSATNGGDEDAQDPSEPDTDLAPTGCGIAAQFPGDQDIEEHPSVIFVEDFEHESMEVLQDRFTEVRRPHNIEFVDTVADASPGEHSIRLQSIGGEDTGSDLYRNLENLDGQTFDELHVRYYVKYAHGHRYHHSGVGLGGYNPPTNWPQGGAGTRPAGDDRFTVRVEPVTSTYNLDMYTYWMHMRGNPGDDSFWGNTFLGGIRPQLPDREWVAVEFRVALNDPVDESNGELTLWLDGQQVIHLEEGSPAGEWIWDTFHPGSGDEFFEGFQWRNDPNLALSFLWLHQYVTGHDDGELSHIWYNDVVLATEYIGPIDGAPCPQN